MELPPLIPPRWHEQPWWQPTVRVLVLVVFVATLAWGGWLRVQLYVGVAEGLAEGKRSLEPDVQRFYELARQMHHPYQSRHREPLHILLIKGSLALFGDRPASVLVPTLANRLSGTGVTYGSLVVMKLDKT